MLGEVATGKDCRSELQEFEVVVLHCEKKRNVMMVEARQRGVVGLLVKRCVGNGDREESASSNWSGIWHA